MLQQQQQKRSVKFQQMIGYTKNIAILMTPFCKLIDFTKILLMKDSFCIWPKCAYPNIARKNCRQWRCVCCLLRRGGLVQHGQDEMQGGQGGRRWRGRRQGGSGGGEGARGAVSLALAGSPPAPSWLHGCKRIKYFRIIYTLYIIVCTRTGKTIQSKLIHLIH